MSRGVAVAAVVSLVVLASFLGSLNGVSSGRAMMPSAPALSTSSAPLANAVARTAFDAGQGLPRTESSGISPWSSPHVSSGNRWLSLSPQPYLRSGHAIAYDSGSDRVVLFGGYAHTFGFTYPFNDTWSFDPNSGSWEGVHPVAGPSGRYAQGLAYDAGSERIILFGGQTSVGLRNDTWAFDIESNTWTNLTASAAPSHRSEHAMAYDSESRRVILFGGFGDGYSWLGDTWAYDFNTNTWANMTPAFGPSGRGAHSMAYDSESDRVILFGGRSAWVKQADTWAYDFNTNTWAEMSASGPAPREGQAMVYDSKADRVILVGGTPEGGGTCCNYLNETWAYDYNENTWRNLEPLGQTPTEGNAVDGGRAMAYDAESDQTVFIGRGETSSYDYARNVWTRLFQAPYPYAHTMAYDSGSNEVILYSAGETFAYDRNTGEWKNLETAVVPSGSAPWGSSYMMGSESAYDAESDRIILFSGWYGDETWAYDFDRNTWTNMMPSPRPPARMDYGMAYDEESDRIVLFGGLACEFVCLDSADTWAYDFDRNTWTNMTPATHPSARSGHAMAYDSESDRVLLFGGESRYEVCSNDGCVEDSAVLSETWAYDYNTNTWANMTFGVRPPGMWNAAMSYEGKSDRIVLFGSACSGYHGECFSAQTWAYDFNAHMWTNVSPSIQPSARWGHAMVYDPQVQGTILFGGGPNEATFDPTTWWYVPPVPETTVLAVAGDANIFGAGHAVPPEPGGWGAGTLPPGRVFVPGPNQVLTVSNVTGCVSMTSGHGVCHGADGDPWYVLESNITSYGGISGIRHDTQGFLVGVFLDSNEPVDPAPAVLDFRSSALGMDFTELSPVLGQTFFVGDGLTGNGTGEVQRFAVPPTATRLYLGFADAYEYQGLPGAYVDNLGFLNATIVGVTVDTENPVIEIASPAGGATFSWTTVTITGTASDDVGVLKVEASLDNAEWTVATGTTSWSATLTLAEGANTIYVRVTDVAGNTVTKEVHVTADMTNPSVTIVSPTDGATLSSAIVTVNGTAWDNLAVRKVEVSLHNATWIAATGTTSWSATLTLAEGTNTIYVRVTDTAGNTATSTIHVTVATQGGTTGGQGIPLWVWPVVGVGIAGLAAAVYVIMRRRRKPAAESPSPQR